MDDKILVLVNEKNYNMKVVENLNVDIAYIYKDRKTHLERKLYKISNFLNLSFFYKWIGFKNVNLSKYNLIILYECRFPEKIIKYIRTKDNSVKIIYWLWNTIGKSGCNTKDEIIDLLNKRNIYKFEIFSFDKNDCMEYNLKYNNQVAMKINFKNNSIKYDLIFCGRDKNRLQIIKKLINLLPNKKFKILIMPDIDKKYQDDDKRYLIEREISYEKIIEYINKSKCIIDIVQKEQGGLTWRPLEAMFYKKKLITNFIKIEEYDFYNKNNIFIIGKDNIECINDFLEKPYKDINEKIVNRYLPKGWIENFK